MSRAGKIGALVWSCAVVAIGLGGCAGPESRDVGGTNQPSEQEPGGEALVNGVPTWNRPEIGAIVDGANLFRCTATLILPHYVLTAAHCFDYQNAPRSGDSFALKPKSGGTLIAYRITQVNTFGPHVTPVGSSLFANNFPAGTGNNDVAIARLELDVPPSQADPAAIADVQPVSGNRVTQWGFGCTSRNPLSGGSFKQSLSWTFGNGSTNGCPGDSGGPLVFGERDAGGAIWGLNSAVGAGIACDANSGTCSIPNNGLDIQANVTWLKEQILDVIKQWEGTDLEVGVDRPGSDLSVGNVASVPGTCQALCQATPDCRAFSYVAAGVESPSARCHFKLARPGWTPNPNVTSGGSVAFEIGIDRPGGDFSDFDLTVADYHLCASECAQNASCVAYTYGQPGLVGPLAHCWLKNALANRTANAGTVSGVKRSLDIDVDRTSRDYTNVASTGAVDCERRCATDGRCKAFSFVSSSSRCFLKESSPGGGTRVGFTSSVKRGLETNVDRAGMDLRVFDMSDGAPETCQAECEKDASCKAWSFVAQGMQNNFPRCWLKSGVPAPSSNPGVVSGLKGMGFF